MKNVLMSGASSGIGKAIKTVLEDEGYRVFNIGRKEADIVCDLSEFKILESEVKKFLKQNNIDVLINCAGIGVFEPHECLNLEQIQKLININLTAPILLTNLCLRSLQKTKGHIINITSIEATKHSKYSALYTATKSGLRDFSLSLFEEVRKNSIKVTSINPDITNTPFFDKLKFEPSKDEDSFLTPKTIANAVKEILHIKGVVTDYTIRAIKSGVVRK
ncbi:MAG: SDR family oxidoreductase [Campylobacteraceae bacterium]|jgi:short-subunit dehydrogenase|nr:SDR family oxidoreductase [Campylobacteraceae bacterium]